LTSQWSRAWHFSGRASNVSVNGLVEVHAVVAVPFARTLPPWVASTLAMIVGGFGCGCTAFCAGWLGALGWSRR